MAEDREKFEELLEKFDIARPKGKGVWTLEEGIEEARRLRFPVLVRPSYVLGGQGMEITHDEEELTYYLKNAFMKDKKNPILIDKYLMGREIEVDAISDGENILIPGIMEHLERAGVHSGDSVTMYPSQNICDLMGREIEVDAISDGENILIPGIMEHLERAGVHSGDSVTMYPSQNICDEIKAKVLDYTKKLALAIGIKGMINIQFIEFEGNLYVIEVNPRASRTVPYISKVSGVPIVDLATKVMLGQKLVDLGYGVDVYPEPELVSVKVPVFSTQKLPKVEVSLGPEMKSTGEVLGVGRDVKEALYKGFVGGSMYPSMEKGKILATINLYVIEVNPRASRTVPYISKVSGVPIVDLATKVMLGQKLVDLGYGVDVYPEPELVSVKVPVFSTQKLPKVEVSLGPEMKSTGEVLGVGRDVKEALYKGFVGGSMYPSMEKGKILATINKHDKAEFLPIAKDLAKVGYKFVATEGTCELLREAGIDCEIVRRLNEDAPNILDVVKNKEVDLVVNTPTKGNDSKRDGFLIRRAAIERNIGVITALDTLRAIADVKVNEIDKKNLEVFDIANIQLKLRVQIRNGLHSF